MAAPNQAGRRVPRATGGCARRRRARDRAPPPGRAETDRARPGTPPCSDRGSRDRLEPRRGRDRRRLSCAAATMRPSRSASAVSMRPSSASRRASLTDCASTGGGCHDGAAGGSLVARCIRRASSCGVPAPRPSSPDEVAGLDSREPRRLSARLAAAPGTRPAPGADTAISSLGNIVLVEDEPAAARRDRVRPADRGRRRALRSQHSCSWT